MGEYVGGDDTTAYQTNTHAGNAKLKKVRIWSGIDSH